LAVVIATPGPERGAARARRSDSTRDRRCRRPGARRSWRASRAQWAL